MGRTCGAQGKRDRKKVNYHGAGGGEMDGSEYEASSDEDETDEEEDGEELEPVGASPLCAYPAGCVRLRLKP